LLRHSDYDFGATSGQRQLQADEDQSSQSWKARAAVLHLMAATLVQSPAAARAALRHEAVLLVLFGFLRQPLPRQMSLHMVKADTEATAFSQCDLQDSHPRKGDVLVLSGLLPQPLSQQLELRVVRAADIKSNPVHPGCAPADVRPPSLQLTTITAAQPLSDADKAAKAALFSRLVEALPGLLGLRSSQGLVPVLAALEAVRTLVAGPNAAHQNLFRWGLLSTMLPLGSFAFGVLLCWAVLHGAISSPEAQAGCASS
jgi:hypothetical protein